jgi:hypothetical protein
MSCSETAGKLKAVKGDLAVTKPNGETSELAEGQEMDILPAGTIAPPTEAGEELGGDEADGDLADAPEVDSRSLQASPST